MYVILEIFFLSLANCGILFLRTKVVFLVWDKTVFLMSWNNNSSRLFSVREGQRCLTRTCVYPVTYDALRWVIASFTSFAGIALVRRFFKWLNVFIGLQLPGLQYRDCFLFTHVCTKHYLTIKFDPKKNHCLYMGL